MDKSLTYYLVLWILKLKGVKKIFKQSPIDYIRLRKDDVLIPRNKFLKKHISRKFTISFTDVTEVAQPNGSQKLLIFLHGGAFVCGPALHHWDTVKSLAKGTDYTIWMCIYPKAPEHQISLINSNIDAVYNKAKETFDPRNIVIMGDSVGGTLCLTLTQRLIKNQSPTPSKLIVISPVIDASMEHPDIDRVEALDPMISKKGVLSAKKMAAGNLDLKDAQLSPLYGSVESFPKTYLFLGEHDICYPDQQNFCEKLKSKNINHSIIIGKEMPHIWPLLPVMTESKKALKEIIKILNSK